MKKAMLKKLVLNKESIRQLDQDQIKEAVGGKTIDTNCAFTACALC
jgi:hypothetical protein